MDLNKMVELFHIKKSERRKPSKKVEYRFSRPPVMGADPAPEKAQAKEISNRPDSNPERRAYSRHAAVVTPIRRYTYAKPTSVSFTPNPRRKNSFHFSTGLSDFSLPHLPTFSFSWRLVSGITALLSASLLAAFIYLPYFRIQNVTINGAARTDAREILSKTGLINSSIFLLNADTIKQDIIQYFPQITDALINASLPSQLSISIQERVPIIAWVTGEKTFNIDGSGILMASQGNEGELLTIHAETDPPVIADESPKKPDESGQAIENGSKSVAETLQKSSGKLRVSPEFLKAVSVLSNSFPAGMQLVYKPEGGLGWKDSRGWQVFMGNNLEDLEMKLSVYESIVSNLDRLKIHPSEINVAYVHAPFIRQEQ